MRPLIVRVGQDGVTVLAEVAKQRGLTAEALAKASGLAKSTILSAMHGLHTPRPGTAERIIEGIHILSPRKPDLADLFEETDQAYGRTGQATS